MNVAALSGFLLEARACVSDCECGLSFQPPDTETSHESSPAHRRPDFDTDLPPAGASQSLPRIAPSGNAITAERSCRQNRQWHLHEPVPLRRAGRRQRRVWLFGDSDCSAVCAHGGSLCGRCRRHRRTILSGGTGVPHDQGLLASELQRESDRPGRGQRYCDLQTRSSRDQCDPVSDFADQSDGGPVVDAGRFRRRRHRDHRAYRGLWHQACRDHAD